MTVINYVCSKYSIVTQPFVIGQHFPALVSLSITIMTQNGTLHATGDMRAVEDSNIPGLVGDTSWLYGDRHVIHHTPPLLLPLYILPVPVVPSSATPPTS